MLRPSAEGPTSMLLNPLALKNRTAACKLSVENGPIDSELCLGIFGETVSLPGPKTWQEAS